MSLALELEDFAKGVAADIGKLDRLPTQDKASLVNAIVELHSLLASAGIHIDDTAGAGATGVVYSADQVIKLIETAKSVVKNDLLGGAGEAYDTFKELQSRFEADESTLTAINASLGKRVRFDAAQDLTATEKAQARSNIGAASTDDVTQLGNNLGNLNIDLVGIYNAAKV